MSQGCSPFQPNLLPRLPVMFSSKYAQGRSQGKVSQRGTVLSPMDFGLAPRKLCFLTPAPTREHMPSSQGFPPISCLTPAAPNTKAHFLLEKARSWIPPPVIPVPGAGGAVSDASSTRKGSGLGPHFPQCCHSSPRETSKHENSFENGPDAKHQGLLPTISPTAAA